MFNTDKGTNATDMEGKPKQKTIFMIEKTPLLEKEINLLIEKMNIANDMKVLFFLNTDNTCDEIKLIRNQIRIKSKRRKKKSKKEKKKNNDFKLGRKIKEDIISCIKSLLIMNWRIISTIIQSGLKNVYIRHLMTIFI